MNHRSQNTPPCYDNGHRLIGLVLCGAMIAFAPASIALCDRPLHPEREDGSSRRIRIHEFILLQDYGFSSDEPGLLAAASSEEPFARLSAYEIADAREIDLLIPAALLDAENEKKNEVGLRVTAARYIANRGRDEGLIALRSIASVPIEEFRALGPYRDYILSAAGALAMHGDQSFVHLVDAAFESDSRSTSAILVLGSFTDLSDPAIEAVWIKAAARLSAMITDPDPSKAQDQAHNFARTLNGAVRRQTTVTLRVLEAFNAIPLPDTRHDAPRKVEADFEFVLPGKPTELAGFILQMREHWATCRVTTAPVPE